MSATPLTHPPSLTDALARADVALFVVDLAGRVISRSGSGPSPLTGDVVFEQAALGEQARRALAGEAFLGEVSVGGVPFDVRWTPLPGTGAVAVATENRNRTFFAEDAFLKVFHASPIPISISSLEGGIFSHCNDAFVRTFGYPREEVVGHGSVELGMWTTSERGAAISELRANGVIRHHESYVRTKSGELLDTIFNMERIELGGRPHLVGFFYDITRRKRAEEELRKLYERLRELDHLKGQLVANVSHELRTPLTLILGLVGRLLREEEVSPHARDDLAALQRNARGLLKQVNDLLDVARLESGHIEIHHARVDLAARLRLVASPFDVLAEERGLALAIETPGALVAEADAEKFERIAANLLSNAVRYTPRGGRIRCTLTENAGRVRLTVADSGPGIPLALRDKVFERFFQVEGGATRRTGGTGLGLAIVKEFTELHGGTVTVDTAPEGGALFTVELPLHAPAGATVATSAEETDLQTRLATTALEARHSTADQEIVGPAGRPLVLVVEDNPDMRRFVARSLETEYRVALAADGAEGLSRALVLVPDLILTDVMMPRASGEELVAAVRARTELDAVPIVLLTAKSDDELRSRLLRGGAQDFVTKPFSVEELQARVSNLLKMRGVRQVLEQALETRDDDVERLATELARRQRELQGAYEGTRAAREDVERAHAARAEFLALVSHELRSPLAVLVLGLDALQRKADALAPEQRRNLMRLSAATTRLGRLVETLIGFADIERTRHELVPQSFAPAELASQVLDEHRDEAHRKHLAIELKSDAPPALDADPRLVKLILSNLVHNAVKFTDVGTVQVEVRARGSRHEFVVRDTGRGIPPELRTKLFEPFVQGEAIANKHMHGMGLGLALAHELAGILGGSITFESTIGSGSTFTLTVPSGGIRAQTATARAK